MDVEARKRLLDGSADTEISRARVLGVDAALQTDLGRPALPGFFAAPDDLVPIEIIRPAAQVLAELAFRERAKLATEVADIGIVDVAGDDVADRVAVRRTAQPVRGVADRVESVAARSEERR